MYGRCLEEKNVTKMERNEDGREYLCQRLRMKGRRESPLRCREVVNEVGRERGGGEEGVGRIGWRDGGWERVRRDGQPLRAGYAYIARPRCA